MKRALCLSLCFLLLLFSIGCKKEELNKGNFYTSAGNSYNTHIRIRLVTEKLTAPVTTLTIKIENDTDYIILIGDNPEQYPWEKWVDGQWVKVPPIPYDMDQYGDYGFLGYSPQPLMPHSTHSSTNNFVKLDAGVYRLRVRVDVTNETEAVTLPDSYTLSPENRIFAEVYFTIAPAPEA